MTFSELTLPEFDQEMANTRRVLERVPEDRMDWQPHPKSHTIGWNANHLVDIVRLITISLTTESFDLAPPGGEPYQVPSLATRKELLETFDRNVAGARAAIAAATDEEAAKPWTLLMAGETLFTLPRTAMVRTWGLYHSVHHRAILCVYLRLNDVPVPGIYGPSGDE